MMLGDSVATRSSADRVRETQFHLDWVDVLRGLASFGVTIFHSIPVLWVGLYHYSGTFSKIDRFASFLSYPARFGYAGVMLFFLLSGFVIHLPNVLDSRLRFRSYMMRRVWRIYPPYAAAVTLSVLVWICLLYTSDAADEEDSV